MRRSEVLMQYKVENGIIRSPGKFEGEALYVPHLWETVLEGFADPNPADPDAVLVEIIAEDLEEFPEIKDASSTSPTKFSLWEDEQGFVHCKLYADESPEDAFPSHGDV